MDQVVIDKSFGVIIQHFNYILLDDKTIEWKVGGVHDWYHTNSTMKTLSSKLESNLYFWSINVKR